MRRGKVKVANLNRKYRLNENLIKQVVCKTLQFLKKSQGATEFDIIFVDDKSIKDLNRIYKKKDRPTDVLSFKIEREEFEGGDVLNEIFISIDQAFKNSRIFKTDFGTELILYVIHGMLHSFGYDDQMAGDRLRMSNKEREVLKYLCRNEILSKVLMPL